MLNHDNVKYGTKKNVWKLPLYSTLHIVLLLFIRKVWRQSEVVSRTDKTMSKIKRSNNDLQNITQKTTDRATRTNLKTGAELRCSGRVSSSWARKGTEVLAWYMVICDRYSVAVNEVIVETVKLSKWWF